jgi:hypothetical protein
MHTKYNESQLKISSVASIFIIKQLITLNLRTQTELKLVSIIEDNDNKEKNEINTSSVNVSNYTDNLKSSIDFTQLLSVNHQKDNCILYQNNINNNLLYDQQNIFSQLNNFIQNFQIKKTIKIYNQSNVFISMSEYNKNYIIPNDFVYRTDAYIKSIIKNLLFFIQTIIRTLIEKCTLANKYGKKKISKPNYNFFIERITRARFKKILDYTIYHIFTKTPLGAKISRQEKNKNFFDKILKIQIEQIQTKNNNYINNIKTHLPLLKYFMTLTLKEIIENYYYESQIHKEFRYKIENIKKDYYFQKQKGFSLLKKFGLLEYAKLKPYNIKRSKKEQA